jgi:phosphate-induced protein 1
MPAALMYTCVHNRVVGQVPTYFCRGVNPVKPSLIFPIAAAALIACGSLVAESPEGVAVKKPYDQSVRKNKSGTPTIVYRGGTVMTGAPVNVYLIYYGEVPLGSQNIINTFFTDLGTAPNSFFRVNDTYYDSTGATVAPSFDFAPVTGMVYIDNPPSLGTHIGAKDIQKIVRNAIEAPAGLPADETGVYFVLTAPTVSAAGFCTSYCAYHTSSTAIVSGKNIKFALVPDPGNECGGCDGNVAIYGQNVTPNGDPGADEMTDSIIHELSETVTDPLGTGWLTSNGEENGDLCNFTYGTPLKHGPANGATANVEMNSHYYLIQLIWTNVSPQHCAP